MRSFAPKFITVFNFLILYLAAVADSDKLKNTTSSFGTFRDSDYNRLIVQNSSQIGNGALQVTPDTGNPADDFNDIMVNKSGRVLLQQNFKLFESGNRSNTTRVASFNSSFLINISPTIPNTSRGEGLAFIVVPNPDVPIDSYGEYLGLTNISTDGNSSNKFLAVEFDTRKQSFDPDDNHLGLNINSVISVETIPLSPLNISFALINGNTARFYNVWINYDGVSKTLEVYMAEQFHRDDPTPMIPSDPLLRSNLDLSDIVEQYSYFGFSASTGNFTQQNCVRRWNMTVEYFVEEEIPWLIIGLAAGIPAVAVMAAICWYWWRKRRGPDRNIAEGLMRLPGMVREFEYEDLKKATGNFDDKFKLGEGGYGVVYRGNLRRENMEVAVKRFSRESMSGVEDFLAELTIINRLRHKHLVPLLGWCHKNNKLLLVYEYMPNGSLDKHIFHNQGSNSLTWTLRYGIASGLASALHYLHNEFDQRVVHRDLKASNIMLDSEFNARLGDFGLARAIDNEKTSYAEAEFVHGTIGYVAPENFHTGKASQLSDIFAFGAVMLELVCGRKTGVKIGSYQSLVDWVWSLYRDGQILDAVDEKLEGEFVCEEVERILLLGLVCSHPIASERPKTEAIVQILKGSVPVPQVPFFKPAFMWPAMESVGDSSPSVDIALEIGSDSRSRWTPQLLNRESYSGYIYDHSF